MKSKNKLFRLLIFFACVVNLHNAETQLCRKWAYPSPSPFFCGFHWRLVRTITFTTKHIVVNPNFFCRFKEFSPVALVRPRKSSVFVICLSLPLPLPFVFIVAHIIFILLTQDTCYPYLNGENVYYLGDTEWFDDPRTVLGFSMVTSVFDVIKNIMKPGRQGYGYGKG